VSLVAGEHLKPVLLFLEVRGGLAVAADAFGQARAPVIAAVAENAVLADLVPVAVPQAGTCDPQPFRPFAPVALFVKAVAPRRSFAQDVAVGALGGPAPTASWRWAAVVGTVGSEGGRLADRDRGDAGGAAYKNGSQNISACDSPGGPFRHLADSCVEI